MTCYSRNLSRAFNSISTFLQQASTQRQRNYLFIHSSKDTTLQLLLVQCLINLHYDLMNYCCLKSSAVLLTILTFTFFVFCADK